MLYILREAERKEKTGIYRGCTKPYHSRDGWEARRRKMRRSISLWTKLTGVGTHWGDRMPEEGTKAHVPARTRLGPLA